MYCRVHVRGLCCELLAVFVTGYGRVQGVSPQQPTELEVHVDRSCKCAVSGRLWAWDRRIKGSAIGGVGEVRLCKLHGVKQHPGRPNIHKDSTFGFQGLVRGTFQKSFAVGSLSLYTTYHVPYTTILYTI